MVKSKFNGAALTSVKFPCEAPFQYNVVLVEVVRSLANNPNVPGVVTVAVKRRCYNYYG